MPVSNTLRDTLIHNAISPKIMKVFISWSGKVSQDVALILKDWLPSVIQRVNPYVSSEDIQKGTNWNRDISKELESTDFGIICLTKGNAKAPWINFEAGA